MATAPLRKCMFVVAGTPVIDSPTAWVTISLPSSVTRTMTALRWFADIASRTVFITASARGSAAEDPGGGVVDVQPVRTARVQATANTRRIGGMPDLGRAG